MKGETSPPHESQQMTSLDSAVLQTLESDLGDRDVVREVVRAYLELLPGRRRAIAESVAAGDLGRLRREAHTLGSSSATVGATELSGLCRELESVAQSRADTASTELMRLWASSCAATVDALSAWLAAP